ncbi:MAG: hypothetical protein U0L09_08855, partial [Christensenellales bacterium]|nr:hypothetical protein [Christensenellales bacterium]
MDWGSIVPAIITGLLSLAGVYFANRKSSALIEYRLKELEKKVDRHNQVVERTYQLEGRMNEIEHDIR